MRSSTAKPKYELRYLSVSTILSHDETFLVCIRGPSLNEAKRAFTECIALEIAEVFQWEDRHVYKRVRARRRRTACEC